MCSGSFHLMLLLRLRSSLLMTSALALKVPSLSKWPDLTFFLILKGIFHLKMNIPSLFTHPHVKPYKCLSYVAHKMICLAESSGCSLCTLKVDFNLRKHHKTSDFLKSYSSSKFFCRRKSCMFGMST